MSKRVVVLTDEELERLLRWCAAAQDQDTTDEDDKELAEKLRSLGLMIS